VAERLRLIDRPCPVCGRAERARLHSPADYDEARMGAFSFSSRKNPEYMHFQMLRCADCDMLFSSPAPANAWLAGAYEGADFDSAPEARFASLTYQGLLKGFVERLPGREGALDIGTGDGAFLERLLELGFSGVRGVEPSAAPIRAAKPSVRRLIRKGVFKAGLFPPNTFSLVTCFQTLEHAPDPLKLARAAFKILKPGGAFLAVGHNFRSLSATLLGRKSPIFDVEHLQLFSLQGMRLMLKRAGFENSLSRPLSNRYPLGYWARLLPLAPGPKARALRALEALGLAGIQLPLRAGNLYAVGFKPAARRGRG
jgi:SAM-dependent methyltransferase